MCGHPNEFSGSSFRPASMKRETDSPSRFIGGTAEYVCKDGFLHYDAKVSSKIQVYFDPKVKNFGLKTGR